MVLLSPAALDSVQVDKEIVQAHERDRPFVPLLYGLTYEQLRAQRPAWLMAFGAAVAVPLPEEDVDGVLPRIIAGLRWLTEERDAAGAAPTAMAAPAPVQRAPAAPVPIVLPAQLTPFIGREAEVAAVRARLLDAETRLLTLTGAGGIGKTRLALEVTRSVADPAAGSATAMTAGSGGTTAGCDGIYFVDLAALVDPALVLPTIAQTLGLAEMPGETPLQRLVGALQGRHVLLLLDNFEQVLDAAPQLGALLTACGSLRVLVTSRAALRVRGERTYAVPPLGLPKRHERTSLEALRGYDAVRLFLAQAQAVQPGFALTIENAPAVAEICARLDGLPLAIELVAARTRVLAPEALLGRLRSRLAVATGGARDLPARQRTLRAAIDWSYSLLDPAEQHLFVRLAVFAGGQTLEATEAVCAADGALAVDVLDGVESLLDKSLLRHDERDAGGAGDGQTRYRMLETLHEYARERLVESGEAEALRARHAAYYLDLAEEAELHLTGTDQAAWLERLEAEHDNLRAALRWSLGSDQEPLPKGDQSATRRAQQRMEPEEVGLRLAAALWRFWMGRGHAGEGRRWLEDFVVRVRTGAGEAPAVVAARAKALDGAGYLAWRQGDPAQASVLFEESLALSRQLGGARGTARALNGLGIVADLRGDYARASVLYEESLTLFREVEDRRGLAMALGNLGLVASNQGDYARASALLEECLALHRVLGDRESVALWLNNLGEVALEQGDAARAALLYEESLALYRELGNTWGIAIALINLGEAAHRQGDSARAAALLAECLPLFQQLGDKWGIASALHSLGNLAREQGDGARATLLYEESLALRRELGDKRGIARSLEGLAQAAAGAETAPESWAQAVRLLSEAEAVRRAIGAPREPNEQPAHERTVAALRAALDEATFEAAWAQGQAQALDTHTPLP